MATEKYPPTGLNRRSDIRHGNGHLGQPGYRRTTEHSLRPRAQPTVLNPHSPDDALSNGALHADSDIGISTLFWIERGGDGKPGGGIKRRGSAAGFRPPAVGAPSRLSGHVRCGIAGIS